MATVVKFFIGFIGLVAYAVERNCVFTLSYWEDDEVQNRVTNVLAKTKFRDRYDFKHFVRCIEPALMLIWLIIMIIM